MTTYPKLNQDGLDRFPKLSPLLTNTAWQKNKGLYAKMAGSTGLGTALTNMNDAYKEVDWTFILFTPILNKDEVIGWGKDKVHELQTFAKANCTKAATFETELGKVISQAKTTNTQFTNSKLPNISTGKKAVADILKAANQMKHEFDELPFKLTYHQWDDFVQRFGDKLK
jgi:hypothetical protein